MNLKKLFLMLTFFVLMGTTAFAQQTWYVNNQTGNDGRNGLSATIPSPDDFVTGPKKTIGGAQGAQAAGVDGDVVVVANTGVAYGAGTGEPSPITITKQLTFQSTGGSVTISSLFGVNTVALANSVVFNSGAFNLTGGLTLTSGTLTNSSQLITVTGGTITVGALATTTKITGQLLYSGTVNFSYGANYTTADEFPASGTIGTLTTTAGNLTLKTTAAAVSGAITTVGTLDLGGNTLSVTGANAHTIGGAVSNGTLAFTITGAASIAAGANALPAVTVNKTTSTLALFTITSTGTIESITASGNASVTVTGAATIGAASSSANNVVLSGPGIVTLSTVPTVNGNVLLNSTGLTAAGTGQINFGAAVTINGNVTNQAGITVDNTATLAAGATGMITFPNAAITITGNVVNNVVLGGVIGTATNTSFNGNIDFMNITTNVTVNGAFMNGSSTSISSSTNPAGWNSNGLITFANFPTTAIIRADGGIANSSNWSTITGANNINNGQIVLGGAARAAGSTIGTAGNRVGAVTNSSVGAANGDGNGNIVIGVGNAVTTPGGFFGTSVSASGTAAGGYITFGNENFNINGNITLTRTVTGGLNVINVGTGVLAGATVTVGGTVSNQSNNNINFNTSSNGTVAITGAVSSSVASGVISWPNLTSATFSLGGLTVSAGTVTVPATHTAAISINGAVNVSGGTVNLLGDGLTGTSIVMVGAASFTGGTVTTTGRTAGITINSTSITFGGASSNTTFSTAAPIIIGNPTPTSLTTVTIGGFNPALAGVLQINNTTGLANAVLFTGGTLTVTGNLVLTAGATTLSNLATISVAGNITNTAGFTTTEQARVSMIGAGVKTFGGAGNFGTIEFNNAAGFNTSSAVTLTGTVYLTAGLVSNGGGAITIDNSTVLPTVVLNAGTFSATPTYNSNVNITYIGGDKATGFELPGVATKLQNLTVATTTGAVAGKGIVTLSASAQVNGTLTVNANQTLSIANTFTLTMKGATILLNGNIINVGSGLLSFAAATGTTVTGAGYLPNVSIAAGSSGNSLAGKAFVNQFLGTDGAYAGAADFTPLTSPANGALTFVGGTNSATVTFTGVTDGSMVGAVTTAGTGNTLNLGANFVAAGALTHAAGTINVGTFTFEQRGAAIALGATGTASFTGTGLLKFYQADATTNSAFTLTSGGTGSTIGINVELNNADATGTEDDLILAGQPLTISGSLTLTDGELVLGQNLTLTGSSFTIAAAATVSGASVLRLNAATAPMTMSYTGTPTISNLRVSNDVNLSGTGTALTISTLFTHDGGVLNFGAKNLTFQTAFTRTAGTYSATTGYMIFDGAAAALAVTQGTDGFSIPNLRITNSGAFNVALSAVAGQGTVTVTGAFDLANGLTTTQTFTTNGKFAVAGGATVNYTSGLISVAPAYAGSVTMVGKSFLTGVAFPALLWPSTVTVTTLTINGAAAVNTIALPGSRTVTTTLNLTNGILTLVANTLTLSAGSTITRTDAGSVTATTGGFAFPSDNTTNVTYYANAAGIGTGIELPAILNNLTLTRNTNGANQATTLNTSVAVNGTLSIKNNFTIPPTPPVVTVSVNGDLSIVNDAATYNLATNPVLTNNQSLVLGGASGDQTVTVPAATPALNIGAITINKTSGNVIIAGGNLATGTITFTKGNIITNAFVLYIPAPTTTAVAGGAQSQGFSGASSASMVVGNVGKTLINTGAIGGATPSTEATNIFPVGTGVVYRPATLTFNPAFGVPTTPNATIVVSHVDSNPGGSSGLPIKDGVATGIDVSRYPAFYWNIYTIGSVGQSTIFDLGLTAGNFTDFDAPANVRIIRRHGAVGDLNNDWLLQGLNTGYDNEVNSTTGFTAINRNSVGGLRTGGAVFTLGVKSNISIKNAIAKQWLVIPQGAKLVSLANTFQGNIGSLSFTAQSSNPAVATAEIIGTSVKLTPLTIGEAVVTVTAVDAANNDFFAYSFAIDSRNTDVATTEEIPTEFALMQNFPNPFNPTTNIKFALPKESNVTLKIYNILGEEVANLVNKVMPAGYHTVNFDATRLASGMYIYRIEAGSFVQVKKMLLMK